MDNSQKIQYTIDRFAAAKISITAEMADKVAVIAIRVDTLTAKKRPQPMQ